MKQLFAGLLALAAVMTAHAQIADVSTPRPLLRGTQSDLYNPILSEDGTKLLFSNSDYSDLRLYDFTLGTTVRISDDARTGFSARFDDDGQSVTYISQHADARGRNLRTAHRYDIATGLTTDAGGPSRVSVLPDKRGNTSVRTVDNRLYISSGNTEQCYSPVEAIAYPWASLSPDGSKVMFVAAGKGVYITDLKGNILSHVGNYEAPVWYGNNHIVAMRATDDGHQYSSSQIVLARADGTAEQEITRPSSMTMNPAASISAGKIIYSTIDGYLYQVDVTLK